MSRGPTSDPHTAGAVVALVPAFQEAASVAAVVEGARAHVRVVVVDDGSTDATAAAARAAGATVLVQTPNQGKGAALRAGFRWAMDAGFAGALTLDADGQHDPTEIPAFLGAFETSGADLVIGRREFRRMPPVRRLANSLGGIAVSWAVGQPIPDNQCGYRLVSRRLMALLLDSDEKGFEFEVEMIARCVRSGWEIDWVPIRTIYAGESSHIAPLGHVRNFIRIVRAARRTVREG